MVHPVPEQGGTQLVSTPGKVASAVKALVSAFSPRTVPCLVTRLPLVGGVILGGVTMGASCIVAVRELGATLEPAFGNWASGGKAWSSQ